MVRKKKARKKNKKPVHVVTIGGGSAMDAAKAIATDEAVICCAQEQRFFEEVAADMRSRQPRFAVVDLRFNGGGTDATNRFAQELPSLVVNNGTIYVVTSRETFSAGIGAAAQIKRFAGDRARIVGGTVGDRLRFIANGGSLFTLPNSGISARVWSTVEDYADGCWDWRECFVLSPFFRTEGVGDLDPHVVIPTNFADYARNRDPVMETILAEVAGL